MSVDGVSLRDIARSVGGGLTRLTISDQVRETLRRAIVTGRLAGGTRLGLAEIAEALGVSTTPVREALRVLSSEGFVQLDAYRGALVRSPDRSEIEEVVRLRRALEPLAMEEAIPSLTPEIIAEARCLLRFMLDQRDSDEWVGANREFHELVYRGVTSQHLLEILAVLRAPVVMYVSRAVNQDAGFRDVANEQHVALFEAMVAGDVATAQAIIIEHVALPIVAAAADGVLSECDVA
jgi:DNA-binding GntR family transcriptional regulator